MLVATVFGLPSPVRDGRVKRAFARFRRVAVHAVIFGFFINMLLFVSPLYMMQVYDRVLSSRSETTLFMLAIIAFGLLAVHALLERLRAGMLAKAGYGFERQLSDTTFDAVHATALTRTGSANVQPLRDLSTLRDAISGAPMIALTDTPYIPLFFAAATLIHPLFGLMCVVFTLIVILLSVINAWWTREDIRQTNVKQVEAGNFAGTVLRNFEVIRAMGMLGRFRKNWSDRGLEALGYSARVQSRSSILVGLTRYTTAIVQIAVLTLGAILVIEGQITTGAMFAASIIVQKALMPVQVLVGSWRMLVSGRSALETIDKLLVETGEQAERIALPAPTGELEVAQLSVAAPGSRKPILRNIHFTLAKGRALGVVGASGSGKSSLVRALIGVWPPMSGAVRLDGAELSHWDPDMLGQHMGYLPQDVALFQGSISENIARFQPDFSVEKVIAAARKAGVHDLIQGLPEGYNTRIGEGGHVLSGGQRQRVGLARAMFGDPALIVLDEPNANLDSAGEEALMDAIRTMQAKGTTLVIVTHKANVLHVVDDILVLSGGYMQGFGQRDEIIHRLMGPKVVSIEQGAADRRPQPRLTVTATTGSADHAAGD